MTHASTARPAAAKLTLGPLLYNWSAAEKTDFYFRIADEAPIDTVYLGEVVCWKRAPLFDGQRAKVIDRLTRAGKTVVRSTLALVMTERELQQQQAILDDPTVLIEANDVSAIQLLQGRPHVVGPFVNIYNEGTLAFAQRQGARRVVLGCEITGQAIRTLVREKDAGLDLEVQVFGRLPLALSARCYHARHHGLRRDSCQYVCGGDGDGLDVHSLDDQPIFTINGTQTLTHGVCCLLDQAAALQDAGVSHLRLWPHTGDMVAVAEVFRAVLDGRLAAEAGRRQLTQQVTFGPFTNGFFFGREGHRFVTEALTD